MNPKIDVVETPGENALEREKEYLVHFNRERRFEEVCVESVTDDTYLEIKLISGENLSFQKTRHQSVKFVMFSDENPRLNKSVTNTCSFKAKDSRGLYFILGCTLNIPLECLSADTNHMQFKLKLQDDLGNEYATIMLNDVVVELLTCYRYEGSWSMDMKYGDKRSDSAKTKLKVAARIINVEKFSRNYEMFVVDMDSLVQVSFHFSKELQ